MATIVHSTVRLKEAFKARTFTNEQQPSLPGRLVGSAMAFLLSEEGAPLLIRLQCEGPVCNQLDGAPEHTRIWIEQGEIFQTSWTTPTGEVRYMPTVRAFRLEVRETQFTVNGAGG